MEQTDFERLNKRKNVSFQFPLSLNELESLFITLTEAIPCRFDYTLESIGCIYMSDRNLRNEQYIKILTGKITRGVKSVDFACDTRITDFSHPMGLATHFTGMRFLTTPEYNSLEALAGRNCDDVETMDLVREQIETYFRQFS